MVEYLWRYLQKARDIPCWIIEWGAAADILLNDTIRRRFEMNLNNVT